MLFSLIWYRTEFEKLCFVYFPEFERSGRRKRTSQKTVANAGELGSKLSSQGTHAGVLKIYNLMKTTTTKKFIENTPDVVNVMM